MSLTDEAMASMVNKTSGAVKGAGRAAQPIAATGAKGLKAGVKGICLILGKGVGFTEKSVMAAIKEVAFLSTGNIKFSSKNIEIGKFQKNPDVKAVSEAVTGDVMKHFDKYCKKYGVKYSAVYDKKENNYTLFFEGKKSEIILKVMQDAFKDYATSHKKQDRGKMSPEKDGPVKKESVKAKLAFFRNRVKDRDAKEKDGLEKDLHRSDRER